MRTTTRPRSLRALAAIAGATCAALALAACGGSSGGGSASGGSAAETCASSASGSTTLNMVAYSVAQAVYDVVQPGFEKTCAGKGVTFKSSYGASGDQSRAVLAGQKADLVAFSLETDVTRLVPSLIDASWNSNASKGMVSDSVVVITVRKGNPLKIKGWDDIVKSGVKIITPNPGSSGAARWNILGAYAHGLASGGSDQAGQDFLKKFYANVVSLPASGRDATTAFTSGTGDVLISYENEAILAKQSGAAVDYIVPNDSFLIENPVAVTKSAPTQAKAFLDYALSPAGQKLFVSKGFRPVVSGVDTKGVKGANDENNPFPTVKTLKTVADLGGWPAVATKFFDTTNGIVTKIQKDRGL